MKCPKCGSENAEVLIDCGDCHCTRNWNCPPDFETAQAVVWFFNLAIKGGGLTFTKLISDALEDMEKRGDVGRARMYERILTAI